MKKGYGACDHIGILTNNVKRLERFYVDKLGFKKEKQEVLPRAISKAVFGIDCDCDFIRLEYASVKIELFRPKKSRLKRNQGHAGNHHWGFAVLDREAFCRKLKAKKTKLIEVKRNSHVVYFAQDPDGNRIEIRDIIR
ncbi:MAG: VOC family protein [Candidatus Omnitrophica bacterium]|nr:VOC family protein [Candidatus Omnitrophota bacterium]